jgi:hypothetical protein
MAALISRRQIAALDAGGLDGEAGIAVIDPPEGSRDLLGEVRGVLREGADEVLSFSRKSLPGGTYDRVAHARLERAEAPLEAQALPVDARAQAGDPRPGCRERRPQG